MANHNEGCKPNQLTILSPRLCDGNFDGPALPTNLLVAAYGVPRGLPAAALKELHLDLAATATVPGAGAGVVVGLVALGVELADERRRALVDQRLQFHVGDVREREVEDLACLWEDRGEEAVEEDRVEDP